MSKSESAIVELYHVFLEKDPAMIMRIDHSTGETTLCLIFSRVSGRWFLKQCIEENVFSKVDFNSFENTWERYNFPDFHLEDETIIDGYSAEILCVYLEVYADMANAGYNFQEVYDLFKEEHRAEYYMPFPIKGFGGAYTPKDVAAMVVGHEIDTVTCYFDKHDALSLLDLYDSKVYKKRTRKGILHSGLPYRSAESVQTYTGLTGELIAYLFWINQAFGY